ncbi:Copia protein, partial [Folsomia candida]
MAHIYACDSAKTTWEKIAEVNSDASILNVQRTLTRFYNFKISEDRSAVEACGELEELARALKEMGNPVTAQALVIKAVSSLPESKFHAFKRAWGSVDAASQTMANLIARIKNEELSFKANGEGGEEQQQFNIAFNAQNGNKKFQKGKSNQQQQQQQPQKKKREGACRNCGIEGHWARECRKPKREEGDEAKCNNNNNNNNSNRKQNRKNNKKQNEGPGDCQAFLGGHEMEEGSTRWISDSGASFHITGRKDWLTDYKEFKNPIPVSITDNSSIRALGKGTVQVEAWVQGEWYPISIHNAHYIPGAVNLFSEGIMDQKGFKIVKENGKTTYYFKGQQGPQAWWLNGNYVMGFRVPKNSAYSATINKTKLWHERLAHVNMGYIKNAVKVGAVEGIKMEDLASDFHCSDCHLGKETRQPFPEREKNKNLQPGDVIHADLSGKDSTTSLQGSNYFLLLKDEKTGFRQVCFLKKKSDAAANIINFLKMFKNQTSKNIKIFKSDNGGEFMCRELQDYFRDQGILHQTSAPRCPETNGLIERDMRTVKEASKTMIIKAGQSPGMWEEAVGFAVYILNRLPNRNSPNCTPFEQVFGWPPDLSHVRTFGCTAYAQIPEEDRDPSDPKARIGKLVGYGTFGRKFKVYIPEKRKVVPARNVSFLEDGGVRTSYEVEEDDAKHENEQQQQQEEQQEKIHDASSQSTSSHTTKPDEEEVFMDADDEGETTILVETPEGNYEYDPDKKKIEIPSRKLRSKDMIKPPKKYQSELAIAFVVDAMKKAFEITRKDLEVFVGIEITIEGGTMTLAQHQYTEALLEKGGGGSLFWTWAMMMCLLGVTQGVNVQNSQPILWRGSPVPVISGYETVYLRIKLISPCTLLTEEIVPKGQLETAKKICNEMYETYFIHEMKQMCPSFHNFSMSKHRPKRFILVALIALGAVVVTGLGIGGVVLAANNAARISDLEEISSLQEKSINQLEEQMNFTEIALQKLRTDFNILVKDHEVLDKNLNEITEKGPNTYFTISYITTKLMMGKQVIKEATRAWNNKKILNGMMDYFNITLPCGEDECPLSLATGKRCYFGEDMKDLYIQMDMPKVNKALQLVEADAFDLMLQTWNQTCRITYNGPENAILSKKEGCPVALNLKTSRMYDLVLSSSQDCLKGFKNKSENSYFSVKHCQGRGEKDAEDFIQVKPHHGSLHVYCFGCNITIDNLSQECPKEVFILPIGARFRINNQEFTGSIVHIEHQDSPDPLFTMRTNAYLKPRVDYQELMKDPMVNNHFVFSKGETWTHSETWHMEIGLIITLLVVIIVLACILTKCYLDHRKIKVKV